MMIAAIDDKTTGPLSESSPEQAAAARVQQAVGAVATLGTLPEITSRIVETIENRNSSAAQLHKIVCHDPALVTRILKVVNSAFYGLPGQIGSIDRAIVLLGLNAVKNLAVAASLGQMFRNARLCHGYTARDLWKHCIAVAVGARDMARQMRLPIAEEAFLGGMIHDVGLLVSLQVMPEKLQQVCNHAWQLRQVSQPYDFCLLERQTLGMDHQQLGMALSAQWKFPRSCQWVAGYHHRPGDLSEDGRMLVTLVQVADGLACEAEEGFPLTVGSRTEDGGVERLGIEPSVIQTTRGRLSELISATGSLLD